MLLGTLSAYSGQAVRSFRESAFLHHLSLSMQMQSSGTNSCIAHYIENQTFTSRETQWDI